MVGAVVEARLEIDRAKTDKVENITGNNLRNKPN